MRFPFGNNEDKPCFTPNHKLKKAESNMIAIILIMAIFLI